MASIWKQTLATAAILVVAGPIPAVAQHSHEALDEQARFDRGVAAYMTLRDEVTRAIPPLTVMTDPLRTRSNVDARAAAIQAARGSARALDVFTPDGARHVRAIIDRVVRDRGERLRDKPGAN